MGWLDTLVDNLPCVQDAEGSQATSLFLYDIVSITFAYFFMLLYGMYFDLRQIIF